MGDRVDPPTPWPVIRGLLGFGAAALLVSGGCSGKPKERKGAGEVKPGSSEVVVARVGKRSITAGQVAEALARQPSYVRMRFTTMERKKAFLDKLVRFEVLVAEAQRRGLERHPKVLQRQQRAMVDLLMKQLNKELVSFSDVSDAEVKARYEKDIAKYKRPARIRAALLLVASEAEAKKILAELDKQQRRAAFFARACRDKNKNAALKARAGDLGFFAKEAKDEGAEGKKLPQELKEAVRRLDKNGAVAGPLKLPAKVFGGGWGLVMKSGEMPAMSRPFKLLRDRIKNQLFHEKRFKAVTGYADKLLGKSKVVINEKVLEGLAATPPKPKRSPVKLPAPMRPFQKPKKKKEGA